MQVHQFNSNSNNSTTAAVLRDSQKNADQKVAWILKICAIAAIPLFAWYILLANAISTKGFLLAQAKQEQDSLQQQIEKLEIELTIPVSLYALESSEQVQEMKTITKQNFVEIRNSEVALAQ